MENQVESPFLMKQTCKIVELEKKNQQPTQKNHKPILKNNDYFIS